MIKHIILSSFLLGGLSNLAYATDLRGHWEVVKIMNNYISSIACEADKVKVEDVINSYWDKEEFNFLSESRNERRWVNPDKSIAKYFKWKKEEVVNVYNYYKRFLKKRDI